MLAKNIIVCADGTGNKGGSSPDSNVYKVYKTVSKNYSGTCKDDVDIKEQIIFYDNGVGTSKNKYWRAISGGFGLGFKHNVCDLYRYLARNYVAGDRIYFFGFSRGASTVRACNGMINKCGLAKGIGLRNKELNALVDEAYTAYKLHKKKPELAEKFKNNPDKSSGAVPIKFLGVWDTVVALGFPKRTDVVEPTTFLLNHIFGFLESIFDFLFPHSFYHYKLTDNVEYACQALAIDDERTAFWPYVWREKDIPDAQDRTTDNVKQVWFAGMHANVGGGYERSGMASVPLFWMMKHAQQQGLMFTSDAMRKAYDDSHVHGRMYDSRRGFNMLYRYHPREIEERCKNRLLGNIKIHHSVIERLKHRTANYVPGHIPASFDVVNDDIPADEVHHNPGSSSGWSVTRKLIDRLTLYRKLMYGVMLTGVLALSGYAVYLWNMQPVEISKADFKNEFAYILDYLTPDMFDGLIEAAVIQNPRASIVVIILLLIYFVFRNDLRKRTEEAGETLRHIIITDDEQDSK